MSDGYNNSDLEEEQPAAAPSPMLQEYRAAFDQPGVAPEARDLAYDQTTLINDYQQRRRLADENSAIGQEFVAGIDNFKSGLVSGVQADPFFLSTALDLTDLTIDGMVSALPVADSAAHRDALIRHTQSEIATAAVTSMAEMDGNAARGMLADERIAGLLGESVGVLDTYITMQERARERDDAGHAVRLARAAEETADLSARNYLGALRDRNTGEFRLPDGWNQGVISDPRVPPMTKVDLISAQDRLMTNGDTPTNPLMALDMIGRLARGEATQRDLYPLIGAGMSLTDATMLSAVARNPQYLGQLASHLDNAARVIAPNGSIAESRALGRFTSALLRQVERGAILDPMSSDWIGGNPQMQVDAFRVQGNDLLDIEQLASTRTMVANQVRNDTGVRRSINQIFGETRNPRIPTGYHQGADRSIEQDAAPQGGALFYGVRALRPSEQIRGGSQRINPEDPEPTSVMTDTGIKVLNPEDLARSSSGPRPQARAPLSVEQQRAILSGRPTTIPAQNRSRVKLPPRRRR